MKNISPMIATATATAFLITANGQNTSTNSIIEYRNITTTSYQVTTLVKNDYSNIYKYNELQKELSSYRKLKNNWDGYGGIRPLDDIINTVTIFLDILSYNNIYSPKIMVSGNGEIALFWKKNEHYIEIDFDTNNQLSFFYEMGTDIYGEDDIIINDIIPQKLYSSLNIFFKPTSSKKSFFIENKKNSSFLTT